EGDHERDADGVPRRSGHRPERDRDSDQHDQRGQERHERGCPRRAVSPPADDRVGDQRQDENGLQEDQRIGGRLMIVDFYADWCGPCKMLSPVLEQLALEHTDVKITKVNVDEEPALAERYRVRGIPYVEMFRGGKLAEQVVGY